MHTRAPHTLPCSPLLPFPPEPLLAGGRVEYHGQPVALVVGESQVRGGPILLAAG
jgi:CO/xanthine dehydrogenase Mo-binding subunit